MRVVIDIDNTLVDYRQIIKDSLRKLVKDSNQFFLENNFKNTKSIKSQIKDKFGDDIWQEIQGLIYSHDGLPVKFFENAEKAIEFFSQNNFDIYIVSHRSKFGLKSAKNKNILAIAQKRIFSWINDKKLYSSIKSIIFCDTYDEKIKTIKFIQPNVIIDDLVSVHLDHKKNTDNKEILYIKFGNDYIHHEKDLKYCENWYEVLKIFKKFYEIR